MNQGSDFSALEPDGQSSSGWRGAVALLIFLGILLLACLANGVVCFFLPRQYYSRVVMEEKPYGDAGRNIGVPGQARSPLESMTVFQLIQSKEVLYPVIDNLKLIETWSTQEGDAGLLPREEVFGRLLKKLKLGEIQGCGLIEIGAFSMDRTEAANIANSVAASYRKLLMEGQVMLQERSLSPLREEVKRAQKSVEETGAKQETARKASSNSPSQPEPDAQLNAEYLKAKRLYAAAQNRLSTQEAQLKTALAPAKIWEQAQPAIYPARPSFWQINTLLLAAGAAVGAACSGLFLLLTRGQGPSREAGSTRQR